MPPKPRKNVMPDISNDHGPTLSASSRVAASATVAIPPTAPSAAATVLTAGHDSPMSELTDPTDTACIDVSADNLPWTLPMLATGDEDLLFEKRNIANGVYTYLLNDLISDEVATATHASNLCFTEVDKHFHSFAQEYGPHKTYRVRKNEDHVFKGFGEILPTGEGTMLSCMGNHYTGPFRQITDRTSVRPSIVIGPPSNAPQVLIEYYNSQIMNINAVVEREEVVDTDSDVKEVVRSSVDAPDSVGNLLYLTLPALYSVRQATAKLATKKRMTRGISNNVATHSPAAEDSNGDSVILGGLYNPALQSDYGSNIFAHVQARLKAHPFYDKFNNLLKPWTLPVSLRAGTLIVFEATFHCFRYGKRKIYQFNVQSLKVLAESPLPPPAILRPCFPDLGDEDVDGTAVVNRSSGLLYFGTKRARVD